MDLSRITQGFRGLFPSRVICVDSHTAGEPTRLIIGGLGSIPGVTMQEKRRYVMENLDHLRLQLTREPRGHRGMFAAIITDPVTDGADFGLIYMDARRYPFLCGHGTMGAVSALIETGALPVEGSECVTIVDTPSGPMQAFTRLDNGLVDSVGLKMVPSFLYGENEILHIPGLGEVVVDTVCVGGFFVMVSSDQIGLKFDHENSREWIRLGMAFIEAANSQLKVRHPNRPEVSTVDVAEFYDPTEHSNRRGKNVVIYGEAHMDRSPCGTGTAAKMTLLHHRGLLGLNKIFTNYSPLGGVFEGKIVEETMIGEIQGVITEVRGNAYITGLHEFVLDARDPFPKGFLL